MLSLHSVFEKLLNKNQVFLKSRSQSRSRAFFLALAFLKNRAAPTGSGSGSPALGISQVFLIREHPL